LLLTISWHWFLALIALGYFVANSLFALAYLAEGIASRTPDLVILDAFSSASRLWPRSATARCIRSPSTRMRWLLLKRLTGLMGLAGQRPDVRPVLPIHGASAVQSCGGDCSLDGVPTLMLRTANQRRNQILEAQLRVRLTRDELMPKGISCAGSTISNWCAAKIRYSRCPTAMHPIDEHSPSMESRRKPLLRRATIIVTLSGIDETVSKHSTPSHLCRARDSVEHAFCGYLDAHARRPPPH